jgi:hypothetical protein
LPAYIRERMRRSLTTGSASGPLLQPRSNRSGCQTLLLGNALGSDAANRLDYRRDTGAGVSLARRGHLLPAKNAHQVLADSWLTLWSKQ